MEIIFKEFDVRIETFTVGTSWRQDAPGVRLTNKETNTQIDVTHHRTQAENMELAFLLLYLCDKHGLKIDQKDELGYSVYGINYKP